MRGTRNGMLEFLKELDRQAHGAGKAAGGVFGKPVAQALTPDNQTAELYSPAAFRKHSRRRSVRQRLREALRKLFKWLKTKR